MDSGWILVGFWIWICWVDSEWIQINSGWILDVDMLGEFWMDSAWILGGFWIWICRVDIERILGGV